MSARFLFTCWPFEGHVLPQMSVGVALGDRGCDVAFYTSDRARSTVESEGFDFFAFKAVQQTWEPVLAAEQAIGGRRQSLRVQRQAVVNWLVGTIPAQVHDLHEVLDVYRPDVIVTDLSMWGPILVLWESVPIPVALSSTFMGPLIPTRGAPPPGLGLKPPTTLGSRLLAGLVAHATDILAAGVRRRVDGIRAQHGLSPINTSVNAFTGRLPLYLVPSLPELDYGRRELPDSVHYVGACTWYPPATDTANRWLGAIRSDRPWVHITEGTSHHQDPFLLRAAAKGLAGRPYEVILTTGGHRDSGDLGLGTRAPNMHVIDWLNHGELLPRCELVVTTGGPATIMAALRCGRPLVVVPTTWDKPDNARRVAEAGVGVRLAPRRCTPRRLRETVEHVLREPAYSANARRIADRLTAADGPSRAAELLDVLATPSSSVI